MGEELSDQNDTEQPRCWCCDGSYDAAEMVALGAHPEVTVCRGCARYLYRRTATLPGRTTPMKVVRRTTLGVRDWVVERELHERRRVGPVLHWLDRHLP